MNSELINQLSEDQKKLFDSLKLASLAKDGVLNPTESDEIKSYLATMVESDGDAHKKAIAEKLTKFSENFSIRFDNFPKSIKDTDLETLASFLDDSGKILQKNLTNCSLFFQQVLKAREEEDEALRYKSAKQNESLLVKLEKEESVLIKEAAPSENDFNTYLENSLRRHKKLSFDGNTLGAEDRIVSCLNDTNGVKTEKLYVFPTPFTAEQLKARDVVENDLVKYLQILKKDEYKDKNVTFVFFINRNNHEVRIELELFPQRNEARVALIDSLSETDEKKKSNLELINDFKSLVNLLFDSKINFEFKDPDFRGIQNNNDYVQACSYLQLNGALTEAGIVNSLTQVDLENDKASAQKKHSELLLGFMAGLQSDQKIENIKNFEIDEQQQKIKKSKPKDLTENSQENQDQKDQPSLPSPQQSINATTTVDKEKIDQLKNFDLFYDDFNKDPEKLKAFFVDSSKKVKPEKEKDGSGFYFKVENDDQTYIKNQVNNNGEVIKTYHGKETPEQKLAKLAEVYKYDFDKLHVKTINVTSIKIGPKSLNPDNSDDMAKIQIFIDALLEGNNKFESVIFNGQTYSKIDAKQNEQVEIKAGIPKLQPDQEFEEKNKNNKNNNSNDNNGPAPQNKALDKQNDAQKDREDKKDLDDEFFGFDVLFNNDEENNQNNSTEADSDDSDPENSDHSDDDEDINNNSPGNNDSNGSGNSGGGSIEKETVAGTMLKTNTLPNVPQNDPVDAMVTDSVNGAPSVPQNDDVDEMIIHSIKAAQPVPNGDAVDIHAVIANAPSVPTTPLPNVPVANEDLSVSMTNLSDKNQSKIEGMESADSYVEHLKGDIEIPMDQQEIKSNDNLTVTGAIPDVLSNNMEEAKIAENPSEGKDQAEKVSVLNDEENKDESQASKNYDNVEISDILNEPQEEKKEENAANVAADSQESQIEIGAESEELNQQEDKTASTADNGDGNSNHPLDEAANKDQQNNDGNKNQLSNVDQVENENNSNSTEEREQVDDADISFDEETKAPEENKEDAKHEIASLSGQNYITLLRKKANEHLHTLDLKITSFFLPLTTNPSINDDAVQYSTFVAQLTYAFNHTKQGELMQLKVPEVAGKNMVRTLMDAGIRFGNNLSENEVTEILSEEGKACTIKHQ